MRQNWSADVCLTPPLCAHPQYQLNTTLPKYQLQLSGAGYRQYEQHGGEIWSSTLTPTRPLWAAGKFSDVVLNWASSGASIVSQAAQVCLSARCSVGPYVLCLCKLTSSMTRSCCNCCAGSDTKVRQRQHLHPQCCQYPAACPEWQGRVRLCGCAHGASCPPLVFITLHMLPVFAFAQDHMFSTDAYAYVQATVLQSGSGGLFLGIATAANLSYAGGKNTTYVQATGTANGLPTVADVQYTTTGAHAALNGTVGFSTPQDCDYLHCS